MRQSAPPPYHLIFYRVVCVRSVCVGGSRPDLCVLTVPSVGLCNLNVSFSGEVFDSSTAESSPAPTTNGGSEKIMVTPTPSRARTTEDLFAAIHRYYHAFSACHHLFSCVTRRHPTPTPTPSSITSFSLQHSITFSCPV